MEVIKLLNHCFKSKEVYPAVVNYYKLAISDQVFPAIRPIDFWCRQQDLAEVEWMNGRSAFRWDPFFLTVYYRKDNLLTAFGEVGQNSEKHEWLNMGKKLSLD